MHNTTVASEASRIRQHLEDCSAEIELLDEPVKRVAQQVASKLTTKLRKAETSDSEEALDCAVRQMELIYGLLGRQAPSFRVHTTSRLVTMRAMMQERVLEKQLPGANLELAERLFNRAARWIEDAANSMYESTQDTSLRLANCALDRCHDALQSDSYGVKIVQIIAEALNGRTITAAPATPAPAPATSPTAAPAPRSWRKLWRVQQPQASKLPKLQTNELRDLEQSIQAVAAWLVDTKQRARQESQKTPAADRIAHCASTLYAQAERALKDAEVSYLSGAPTQLHLPRIRAILETADALTGHASRSIDEHVKAALLLRTVGQSMREMESSSTNALNPHQIEEATKHIHSACRWLEKYGSTELRFWSIADTNARLAYDEAAKAQAALNNAHTEKQIQPRTGALDALRQYKS